jgi:hypothetical protein
MRTHYRKLPLELSIETKQSMEDTGVFFDEMLTFDYHAPHLVSILDRS